MNFSDLGLYAPILKALQQEGYTEPTPIQRKAIPPALEGRDVLGCAQTGTGKTCAFSTPILQRLAEYIPHPREIRALILTPTRELAIQIQDSMTAYGRNLPLRSAAIFGGVGQQPQVEAIRRGLDILVATPGRLLDLHGQGFLDLSHITMFVLDEADRMLDMGFIHDVKRVLRLLPDRKQTMLFSATMPPEVMGLVNGVLHNYVKVAVNPVSSPVEVIRQSLYYVDKSNKTKLLAHLMGEMDIRSALVFSRTKHGANRIAQDLSKRGISAAAIHGNKSQTARVKALNDFKEGRVRVLVATDIAARGIDIDDLTYVFNYNLPDVPETYVHRIGRTGRAGREGTAISFCQFDERDELRAIERLLGRAISTVEEHPFPMENLDLPQRDRQGRLVNAEDAEARAAAKQRRRQRDVANKDSQVKPTSEERSRDGKEAPAQHGAGRKGRAAVRRKGVQSQCVEPSLQSEEDRRQSSGMRRGRLEDTLPDQPSMPAPEFHRPSPLASDVILDATARLLAPRRSSAPARSEGGRRSSGQPQGARSNKTRARPGPAKHQAGPRGGPTLERGKEAGATCRPGTGKRRRRNDRPRPIEVAPRSDRQKDSTQQKSLMRPYYINDDN